MYFHLSENKFDSVIQEKYTDSVKMAMQVHDELVFEVAEDKLGEVSAVIKKIMEEAVKLSVPLDVNVDSGQSWDQAH